MPLATGICAAFVQGVAGQIDDKERAPEERIVALEFVAIEWIDQASGDIRNFVLMVGNLIFGAVAAVFRPVELPPVGKREEHFIFGGQRFRSRPRTLGLWNRQRAIGRRGRSLGKVWRSRSAANRSEGHFHVDQFSGTHY